MAHGLWLMAHGSPPLPSPLPPTYVAALSRLQPSCRRRWIFWPLDARIKKFNNKENNVSNVKKHRITPLQSDPKQQELKNKLSSSLSAPAAGHSSPKFLLSRVFLQGCNELQRMFANLERERLTTNGQRIPDQAPPRLARHKSHINDDDEPRRRLNNEKQDGLNNQYVSCDKSSSIVLGKDMRNRKTRTRMLDDEHKTDSGPGSAPTR